MLLSRIASVLTLVAVGAVASPLGLPALNQSAPFLSKRVGGHSKGSSSSSRDRAKDQQSDRTLWIKDIHKLDEELDNMAGKKFVDPNQATLAKLDKAYRKKHAVFKDQLWNLYPAIKEHVSRVFNDLEPTYYNSRRYAVSADDGYMSFLEAEIERTVLIRETIARESGDKAQVKQLNGKILALHKRWVDQAERRTFFPTKKRLNSYAYLLSEENLRRFAFYATGEGGYPYIEAHLQPRFEEYLKPQMYGTRKYELADYLDEKLCERSGQVLTPVAPFGHDSYARYEEQYEALVLLNAAGTRHLVEPPTTYEKDTRVPGPGWINILEAEIFRAVMWDTMHDWKEHITPTSAVKYVRRVLRIRDAADAWTKAVAAKEFWPTPEKVQHINSIKALCAPMLGTFWLENPKLHEAIEAEGLMGKVLDVTKDWDGVPLRFMVMSD